MSPRPTLNTGRKSLAARGKSLPNCHFERMRRISRTGMLGKCGCLQVIRYDHQVNLDFCHGLLGLGPLVNPHFAPYFRPFFKQIGQQTWTIYMGGVVSDSLRAERHARRALERRSSCPRNGKERSLNAIGRRNNALERSLDAQNRSKK